MIEITNGIQLFRHRKFSEWHTSLKPQEGTLACPDANCPWENHYPDNSEHDPVSVNEILALLPGTRMLVLADYCKRWYVSLLTLKSIFEPEGSTQLRFMEGSKQCWYFLPGPYAGGHMLYLDSIRYIAVVQSSVAAFGKDAKLPCFMRELSRIGGVPFSEVRAGIWKLEESIATPPLLLKPWQEQATSLWNHFCSQSYVELADELRYLFSFKRGYYPVAIFFVVAAQRRKLRELSTVREIREVSFPADFGTSITVAIRSIATSLTTFQQDQRSWWSDFQKYFGIQ